MHYHTSIDELLSQCQPNTTAMITDEIRVIDSSENEIGIFEVKEKNNCHYFFGKVFYNNLLMIDGEMPRLLSIILDRVELTGGLKTSEILSRLINTNPLSIDKDWIESTYRFKLGRMLYCLILGMNENCVWNGVTPKGGIIFAEGDIFKGYNNCEQTLIGDYLMGRTEFKLDKCRCYITFDAREREV